MPKISFILPVYKVEKYIGRAIDSLKSQTMDDWEAIFIDDGSPDHCGEICDAAALADSRIQVIHQENAGVGAARNAGIEAAKGEYVLFFDPDDSIEPDMAEKLTKAADENQADIVIYGLIDEQTDKDGNVIKTTIMEPPVVGVYKDEPFKRLFPKIATFHLTFLKLFRRDIIADIRYPSKKIGEDGMFFARVYQQSPKCLVGVKEAYYHYYHRADSASVTYYPERLNDNFYLTKEIVKVVESWGLLDSEEHLQTLMYSALLDLQLSIKNAGMAPMTFPQKVKWLRNVMSDEGIKKALKTIPVKKFNSRNDRLKVLSLKLRLYPLTMLMTVLNNRQAFNLSYSKHMDSTCKLP